MTRLPVALLAGATVVAAGFLAAPTAQAEGLGGVSGWSPSTNVCGTGNAIPVLIGNASDTAQTGSVTVPGGLAANVQIFTPAEGTGFAQGCGRAEMMQAPGYSYDFTVQPYSSTYFWVVLGGVDYNAIGDSHDIALGGLPSGTPGQGWFDLKLSLSATESFDGLQANYKGTGGTNGSNQNNFNLVACATNAASGTVELTSKILTPYSIVDTNGPSYGWGDPVCSGWFPQGEMVWFDNMGHAAGMSPAGAYTVAAQVNESSVSGDDTISFAGAGGQFLDTSAGMSVVYSGTGSSMDGQTTVLGTEPDGPDAFYSVFPNNQWAAVNIPIPAYATGTVTLYNGSTALASYSWPVP